MKWNLDNIYTGFDSKEYIRDFENLNKNIKDLKEFINSHMWEKKEDEFIDFFEKVILKYEEIEIFHNKIHCFIFLTLSCNSSNKVAINEEAKLMELGVEIVLIESIIVKNLSKRKEKIDFSKSLVLKEYEYFVNELIESGKYLLSEEVEEPIAFALNNIKKTFIYDSRKRGYKSPLNRSLKQNRISEEIFTALMEAIKESLPFFREFLKLKAVRMGNKSGKVAFSDLFVSTLKTDKKIDFEFAKNFLIENFYSFSKEFGEFSEKAFNNNWIDSEIYEGKVGGAFCDFISHINESRILLNFSNSYDSIFTLAHELGHAYHGEVLRNERGFNKHYPMVIAETASIFSETLICDKAYNMGSDLEKIIILEYELNSATQTIVDIYSRFLFEQEVFNRCEKEFLTPKDLNEIMKNAQKESYGDAMDEEYFENAWIYKSHYYSFDNNFYNYPYAFGNLFSLGLYNLYLNSPEDFNEKYKMILRNSGKKDLKDLGQMCNLNLDKKEFFIDSINILKGKFLKYKELVSKI